jgi:hypothetical protein
MFHPKNTGKFTGWGFNGFNEDEDDESQKAGKRKTKRVHGGKRKTMKIIK